MLLTRSYPLAINLAISLVTSVAFVNGSPDLPSSSMLLTPGIGFPLKSTNLVTAFCLSFTYSITVFSVGVVGVGGTYPLVGSFGSTGFSGFPFGSFGVVPGIYGSTGTLGLFGSFGFVGSFGSTTLPGSFGSFGYGIGSIGVSPSGTFGVHVPTGT